MIPRRFNKNPADSNCRASVSTHFHGLRTEERAYSASPHGSGAV